MEKLNIISSDDNDMSYKANSMPLAMLNKSKTDNRTNQNYFRR